MELRDEMIAIAHDIIENKIVKKHEQYGSSLEEPALIFNSLTSDRQALINLRIDDKLKRIEQLDPKEDKYWSEIEEIIAYLLWKLKLKKDEENFICVPFEGLFNEKSCNCGQQGNKVKSSEDIRKESERTIRYLGFWGLPSQ
jgi:hypothetical protein